MSNHDKYPEVAENWTLEKSLKGFEDEAYPTIRRFSRGNEVTVAAVVDDSESEGVDPELYSLRVALKLRRNGIRSYPGEVDAGSMEIRGVTRGRKLVVVGHGNSEVSEDVDKKIRGMSRGNPYVGLLGYMYADIKSGKCYSDFAEGDKQKDTNGDSDKKKIELPMPGKDREDYLTEVLKDHVLPQMGGSGIVFLGSGDISLFDSMYLAFHFRVTSYTPVSAGEVRYSRVGRFKGTKFRGNNVIVIEEPTTPDGQLADRPASNIVLALGEAISKRKPWFKSLYLLRVGQKEYRVLNEEDILKLEETEKMGGRQLDLFDAEAK